MGPNSCSTSGCAFKPWFCSSNTAASQNASWVCSTDIPDGSLPNAAGLLCFDSIENCHAGPNVCSAAQDACGYDPLLCSTGIAAASTNGYFCNSSLPANAAASPTSGLLCYTNVASCLSAPNACDLDHICTTPPLGACPDAFQTACPLDIPTGGILTSGGVCYSSLANCSHATACGFLAVGCVTASSCPNSYPFECIVSSAPLLPSGSFEEFMFSTSSGSNFSPAFIAAQVAALLSLPLQYVTVSAPPSRRVLLSFSYFIRVALAANQTLSVLTLQQLATNLSTSLSVNLSLVSQPTTTSLPSVFSVEDLTTLLSLGVSRIAINAHLVLAGQPLSLAPGSSVSLIGNAACASGGDPSGTGLCSISAQYLSQHFLVGTGANLTITNLALINARASLFSSNPLYQNGGSISALAGTQVTLLGCAFINCSAPFGYGGAVYSRESVSYSSNTTFVNTTEFAGGHVLLCTANEPTYDAASGSCAVCPLGQVSSSRGGCAPCVTGSYWLNRTTCQSCPSGEGWTATTTSVGAPSLGFCNCPAGLYRVPVSGVTTTIDCLPCPEGAVCPGGADNRAYALEGYWRELDVDATEFYDCEIGRCDAEEVIPVQSYHVQLSAGTSGEVFTSPDASGQYCAHFDIPLLCVAPERISNCVVGHTGPACGVCEAGYTMQNGVCAPCSQSTVYTSWPLAQQIVIDVLTALFVVCFTIFIVCYPVLPEKMMRSIHDLIQSSLLSLRRSLKFRLVLIGSAVGLVFGVSTGVVGSVVTVPAGAGCGLALATLAEWGPVKAFVRKLRSWGRSQPSDPDCQLDTSPQEAFAGNSPLDEKQEYKARLMRAIRAEMGTLSLCACPFFFFKA